MKHLDKLIQELIRIPEEKPWLEFKHNNYAPDMIGKDISALANSAALYEKKCAYMLWGVTDGTHELCGTKYDLQSLKKGSQEIGNWLRSLLSPNAEFEFHTANIDGKQIGVLMVYPAVNQAVTFEKIEYIRSGSYTKKLSDFPALKIQLWDKIRNFRFEERYAQFDLPLSDALQLLDYTTYFERKALTLPTDLQGIAHYLLEEGLLIRQDNGLFAITNLGAVTLAKKLSHFDRLSRKALRIVQYDGTNRLNILRDETFDKGYISAFDSILKYMEALIPASEPIIHGLREKQTAYPLLAIRELLANALIHQDFAISGAGPVVEIFKNRIEITNPGTPLVDVYRIIDNPPKSRNEKLASLLRQLKMCEELGTGWDKTVIACEFQRLPAPKIDIYEDSMKVTLYAEIPFTSLSQADRLWACYLHGCVKWVSGEQVTNSSLRARFGLKPTSSATISRLIKEAVSRGLLKPADTETAPRYMKYIPIWA